MNSNHNNSSHTLVSSAAFPVAAASSWSGVIDGSYQWISSCQSQPLPSTNIWAVKPVRHVAYSGKGRNKGKGRQPQGGDAPAKKKASSSMTASARPSSTTKWCCVTSESQIQFFTMTTSPSTNHDVIRLALSSPSSHGGNEDDDDVKILKQMRMVTSITSSPPGGMSHDSDEKKSNEIERMLLTNPFNVLWLPPNLMAVKHIRQLIQSHLSIIPAELMNIIMDYLIHS
jgi:hypothetical protein